MELHKGRDEGTGKAAQTRVRGRQATTEILKRARQTCVASP